MTYVTKELEESEETAELEDKVQLPRPELSFGPVAERPMQGCLLGRPAADGGTDCTGPC